MIKAIIKELRYVKSEMLEKFDWLNTFDYEFQFMFPLENYTIIVGVNRIELINPSVYILEVTDDNGQRIELSEKEEIELQTILDQKKYAE